jgi:hypothetical protein
MARPDSQINPADIFGVIKGVVEQKRGEGEVKGCSCILPSSLGELQLIYNPRRMRISEKTVMGIATVNVLEPTKGNSFQIVQMQSAEGLESFKVYRRTLYDSTDGATIDPNWLPEERGWRQSSWVRSRKLYRDLFKEINAHYDPTPHTA